MKLSAKGILIVDWSYGGMTDVFKTWSDRRKLG
jgi:hypothetical protein